MQTLVHYSGTVADSVRKWCDAHSDRVSEVVVGSRRDPWRYMAYLRKGWNQGDDVVHSVIGDNAQDLLTALRRVNRCACEDCLSETRRCEKR